MAKQPTPIELLKEKMQQEVDKILGGLHFSYHEERQDKDYAHIDVDLILNGRGAEENTRFETIEYHMHTRTNESSVPVAEQSKFTQQTRRPKTKISDWVYILFKQLEY